MYEALGVYGIGMLLVLPFAIWSVIVEPFEYKGSIFLFLALCCFFWPLTIYFYCRNTLRQKRQIDENISNGKVNKV